MFLRLALKKGSVVCKFAFWVFSHPQLVARYWRRLLLVAVGQEHFSYRIDLLGLILLRTQASNKKIERPILIWSGKDWDDVLSRVARELCETISISSKSELEKHRMLAKVVGTVEIQTHHVDWLTAGITLDTVLPRDFSAEKVIENFGVGSGLSVAYFFNETEDLQSRLEISERKRRNESWLQSDYNHFSELVTSSSMCNWKQIRAGAWTSHQLPIEWSELVVDLAHQRMTMDLQIALARKVTVVVSDAAGGFWLAASLGKPHLVVNLYKYATLLGPRGLGVPVIYSEIETGRVIPYSEVLSSRYWDPQYREMRKIRAIKASSGLIKAAFDELKVEIESEGSPNPSDFQLNFIEIARQNKTYLRGGCIPRICDAFLRQYPEWIK